MFTSVDELKVLVIEKAFWENNRDLEEYENWVDENEFQLPVLHQKTQVSEKSFLSDANRWRSCSH